MNPTTGNSWQRTLSNWLKAISVSPSPLHHNRCDFRIVAKKKKKSIYQNLKLGLELGLGLGLGFLGERERERERERDRWNGDGLCEWVPSFSHGSATQKETQVSLGTRSTPNQQGTVFSSFFAFSNFLRFSFLFFSIYSFLGFFLFLVLEIFWWMGIFWFGNSSRTKKKLKFLGL